LRKRIFDGCHDAHDARPQQRLGAGWRLAVMAAGFERNIGGGPSGILTGILQCQDFSVRPPESLMTTFADDLAIANEHTANHWVRFNKTLAARGNRECSGHETVVICIAACHGIHQHEL
jgi:hypothetical protein